MVLQADSALWDHSHTDWHCKSTSVIKVKTPNVVRMCAQSPPTREDEMGTPYHIIVDEKTLETGIVALQDRDTTAVVGCYTKYTTSVMCIHSQLCYTPNCALMT